jgi:hypothetical protein
MTKYVVAFGVNLPDDLHAEDVQELLKAACQKMSPITPITIESYSGIDVLEALSKIKFVLLHPRDKEKTWPLWNLTQETIEAIAKENGLSITGKDLDEIARITKKGIDAALDFVWEEAIENAIKDTKADWKFSIVDRSLSNSSERRSGNSCELTETWAGEVECKSEGASFLFDFELVHHVTEDDGGDTAKITSSKPDVFNEDEWDDLTYAVVEFIETTYRAEHWKEAN